MDIAWLGDRVGLGMHEAACFRPEDGYGASLMMRLPWLCVGGLLLSACGMHSSNLRVGNEQSMISLRDQHEAALTVTKYDAMPGGAQVIGPVDAARCHRLSNETAPTDDMVLADLKNAAYAKGANGITAVVIVKKSGLSSNCWHILDGRATAIIVAKAKN